MVKTNILDFDFLNKFEVKRVKLIKIIEFSISVTLSVYTHHWTINVGNSFVSTIFVKNGHIDKSMNLLTFVSYIMFLQKFEVRYVLIIWLVG